MFMIIALTFASELLVFKDKVLISDSEFDEIYNELDKLRDMIKNE